MGFLGFLCFLSSSKEMYDQSGFLQDTAAWGNDGERYNPFSVT